LDDQQKKQRFDRAGFGLTENKPLILAFGAVWCKPCRAEIAVLNRLTKDMATQLAVVGLVVEGSVKGQVVTEEDLTDYLGPDAKKPEFAVRTDRKWQVFTSLTPAAGKTLPFLVFVHADNDIAFKVQRTLDYDSELLPMAQALVRNEELSELAPTDAGGGGDDQGEVNGDAGDTSEDESVQSWEGIATWLDRTHVQPGQPQYDSLHGGWKSGRVEYGFSDLEMPFEEGSIHWSMRSAESAADAALTYVDQASWHSESGCKLNVTFDAKGKVTSTFGVCT
jgi:thiol-disulfide isomerase/thioredoxin